MMSLSFFLATTTEQSGRRRYLIWLTTSSVISASPWLRSAGKISGSYLSCRATSCSPAIQKYLGITLLPQAGVALGMAATAAELSDGHMVRNVVLFSVLVYELVGPTLTKLSLTAAGEIRPEGRTSARVENQPEAPVELS